MEMRQPPRFVPTLTDVVADSVVARPVIASPVLPETSPLAAQPMPFSEIPVLQDMLQDAMYAEAETALTATAAHTPSEAEPDWSRITHTLQTKVMQRLELHLQGQLSSGIADLVKSHTQELCQALQADVERLVAHTVQETLAQELENFRQISAKR